MSVEENNNQENRINIDNYFVQLLLLNRAKNKSELLSKLYERYKDIRKCREQQFISNGVLSVEQLDYLKQSKRLSSADIVSLSKHFLKEELELEEKHKEDLESQNLSMYAYSSKRSIKMHYANLGYKNIQFVDRSVNKTVKNIEPDIRVIMAEKDDEVVVVFRGTATVDNVLRSLKFAKVKDLRSMDKDRRFHRGFKEYLDMFKDEVLEKLNNEYSLKGKKLHYVGHSLGAALSIGLATQKKPDRMTTFGAPRVSNKNQFTSYFDSIDKRRFNNYTDVISRLPFEFLGFDSLYEDIMLDASEKPKFFGNHSTKDYGTQIIQRILSDHSFSEFAMASLFSLENFDLIKTVFEQEFNDLMDQVDLMSEEVDINESAALENIFKTEFKLKDNELLNYKEAIVNPHKVSNAFRVIQSVHDNKLDKLVDGYKTSVELEYRLNRFKQENEDSFYNKVIAIFAIIGTAISSAIKSGSADVIKYAYDKLRKEVSEYKEEKEFVQDINKSTPSRMKKY